MDSSAGSAATPGATQTRSVYRLQRQFFAATIFLGTAAILISAFANPPYFGPAPGIAPNVAADAAAPAWMVQIHLVTLVLAAYLLPLSFLAMAWLANRRAPWLASIGALVALLGFMPLALYAGQDALFYDLARGGSRPEFVQLAVSWNGDGVMTYYGIIFGLGTVFGPALIGLALWRARAVPTWSAMCITFSRLPVFFFLAVPYGVATAIVLAGTVVLFAGSVPAAVALWKINGEG